MAATTTPVARMLPFIVLLFVMTLFTTTSTATGSSASPPNIVYILTDDMGAGAGPGYTNPEVITPALDALAAEGLQINQFYTFKFCSPSRAAFLTGRLPWRTPNARINFLPAYVMDGTPLGYTMLPARLASAPSPFVSYHIGKWHQGLYYQGYTPLARGFNFTNGFLSGGEDHFEQFGDLGVGNCGQPAKSPQIRDIFVQNATAPELVGQYTGTRFGMAAVEYIQQHARTYGGKSSSSSSIPPLFMYLALHNTHAPNEALPEFEALYPNITWPTKKTYYAMVSTVDAVIANVTAALKAANMYENTLIFWGRDNGAPVQVSGSNYPLRGGKGSNWEGGIKCPALVSGGALPASQRGKVANEGIMHMVDLYATFLAVAGISDANDPGGPAPIDSLNMWPWLSGQVPSSPRNELVIDHNMFNTTANGVFGAMRVGKYKLLVGPPGGEPQASWYGEFSPNQTDPNPSLDYFACSNAPTDSNTPPACIFDLEADPTEHVDLASTNATLLAELLATFASYNTSYHPPQNNPPSDEAGLCAAALLQAPGIATPWKSQPVGEDVGTRTRWSDGVIVTYGAE